MTKIVTVIMAFVLSAVMFAGVELKYTLDGSDRIFLAQSNNLKVVMSPSEPWILFDIKNQKIYVIQDDEKKFVEMTKAELENVMGAANNLSNAFGKGKIDLKAMTQKKQKDAYVNIYTTAKVGTGKSIGGVKSDEYSASTAKGKAGKAYFSQELEKAISKEIEYNKVIKQILDITTTKVMLDEMNASERYAVDILDSAAKSGKYGAVTEAELKGKSILKFVSMSKKEIDEAQFKVPEGYTKKSIKDFLGK